MPENQTEFKGWARVEVMGHQSHVGYVTTEAYGAAVLFRIDQPAIPAAEETLSSDRWIGDVYAKPGSVVQCEAIPASSVLVGSGSIYRIIPCDEAAALSAIRSGQRRPLILVKLAEGQQITAGEVSDGQDSDDEDESESPDAYMPDGF